MTEFEKNNFANFEASDAMKEAGFDEPCFAVLIKENDITVKTPYRKNSHLSGDAIASPLFQQATKWFRETHRTTVEVRWIDRAGKDAFHWQVVKWVKGGGVCHADGECSAEPEAYNAAIIMACEIVKAKSQIVSQNDL